MPIRRYYVQSLRMNGLAKRTLLSFILAALALVGVAQAEIYEYVRPDGTVEYTTERRSGQRPQRVIGSRVTDEEEPSARPSRPNPNPQQGPDVFDSLIDEAARAYDMPPELIKAVIRAESGFDPHAVSVAGAMGLMQLMPATAEFLNCADPFDPRENIMAGTQYLRILSDRYNGDLNLILGAYNAGSGAMARAGGIPFENTRRYIERVYGFYRGYLEE